MSSPPTPDSQYIKNPHLEGGPFLWEGGPSAILLVHGFTATTAEVRPLGQALHAAGYTVTGPVIPGHNASPEDVNRYTWKDWVAAVESTYLDLASRYQHVFVGGESTGGLLALALAEKYPGIAGLLVYAPALKLTMSRMDQVKLRLLAPFIPILPKAAEEDNLPWQGYTVHPLKGIIQLLKLQKQVEPHLSKISQPILIIQGRRDTTVDPAVPEKIYNQVSSPIKELYWMKDSAHCVILDSELIEVTQITLEFLNKVRNDEE